MNKIDSYEDLINFQGGSDLGSFRIVDKNKLTTAFWIQLRADVTKHSNSIARQIRLAIDRQGKVSAIRIPFKFKL